MFKKMVLLSRKSGLSRHQFQTHWAGRHADIIKSIIRHFPEAQSVRYTQNRVIECLWENPSSPSRYETDGIVELHVPIEKPSEIAIESGAVDEMLSDELRFLRMLTECVVDHDDDDEELGARSNKVVLVAARQQDVIPEEFRHSLRSSLGDGIGGVRQSCFNWTSSVVHREHLRSEEIAPDVFVEFWIDGMDAVAVAVDRLQLLSTIFRCASIFRVEPLRIL
jgi:hypothetical protein